MTKIKDLKMYDYLWIVLVALSMLDFFTTKIFVDLGGFEMETNPMLFWIITTSETIWSILAIKVVLLLILGVLLEKLRYIKERAITDTMINSAMIFLIGFYAVVVTVSITVLTGI